jgi:hypothetical protein
MIDKILNLLGKWFAHFITKPNAHYTNISVFSPAQLKAVLKPGDVILVEGDLRVSTAIKYLTQSTWSHSALYTGSNEADLANDDALVLIEADLEKGVIPVPLSKYKSLNVRICRPVGLTPADCQKVVSYVKSRIGNTYDLKNVFDLARYLIPSPPVPKKYRRRLLAFGSSDPTKAICSSLIAEAFQSVRYPVLPDITHRLDGQAHKSEILHIRSHSLYVPRDFDLSPYFEIVKPTLVAGFNYKKLEWGDTYGKFG